MIWSMEWRSGELTPSATNREQMPQANRMVTTQPVKICGQQQDQQHVCGQHVPLPLANRQRSTPTHVHRPLQLSGQLTAGWNARRTLV